MDIRTRLDCFLHHTAVVNPSHMENEVGPTAHHQRRTKLLVSLYYTVIALLLVLQLVAKNNEKILPLLNNISTNSTEVFFPQMQPIKPRQLLSLCMIN